MTKKVTNIAFRRVARILVVSSLTAVLLLAFLWRAPSPGEAATSVELRQQASDLQAQIDNGNAQAKVLAEQADSLKKTIAQLDIQISQSQVQIQLTGVKIAQLQDKLDKTQLELDRQKGLLRAALNTLYKKQGASTVELLVGSDTFSQFIDQQEYLDRLKSSIQDSTKQVVALKNQISEQQKQEKDLLNLQQAQKADLDNRRGDRANVLAKTEGDEVAYKALVESLKAQQLQVNRQLFAQIRLEKGNGNNGGYPYANGAFSMAPGGCVAGDGPDRWGYCTRQCVSYSAWAVERSGRQAPYGYGNASDWVTSRGAKNPSEIARGVTISSSPHEGDVAIHANSGYGHAFYIESVSGDTMRISQYNAQLTGEYSEADIPSSQWSSYQYIHFP